MKPNSTTASLSAIILICAMFFASIALIDQFLGAQAVVLVHLATSGLVLTALLITERPFIKRSFREGLRNLLLLTIIAYFWEAFALLVVGTWLLPKEWVRNSNHV